MDGVKLRKKILAVGAKDMHEHLKRVQLAVAEPSDCSKGLKCWQ